MSGLEQGLFIPALVFMNGFRFGKNNWEIAFGPSLSITKKADGFYDENHNWYLRNEWWDIAPDPETANPYDIVSRLDARGDPAFSSRWIWGFGRTFQSGYLNIPVNLYFSAQKTGWYIGASVGFNVGKRRHTEIKTYDGR